MISFRAYVTDVKLKTESVLTNQARAPTAQVQPVGYDTQSLISEMRDGMNQLKNNFAQAQRGLPIPECPKVSCVSLTTLLIVVAVQLFVMLGYSMYK